MTQAITVLELNRRLSNIIAVAPSVQNVWVIGETSDVRVNTHCYFELLQKDENGKDVARIRANIWASNWVKLAKKFRDGTRRDFTSGMKVMVRVTAGYHPNYGMSVTVQDIEPGYTLGDAVARRNAILDRLSSEGLLEIQRNLRWNVPSLRVAVVSARGAAGYGDFINQLFNNPYHLAFSAELIPASMQGERTVPSVMQALDAIEKHSDRFDCVVIIRGGGATSDLAWFDNYELAARIARFPVPVIVGIGHERDVTVLDYVANMRVKTPTAAAEWLIARGKAILDWLTKRAATIFTTVTERMAGDNRQLTELSVRIPALALANLERANNRLERVPLLLKGVSESALRPRLLGLDHISSRIISAVDNLLLNESKKLDSLTALVDALSPRSVLSRGFSITCGPDGHALHSVSQASPGTRLTTTLASGTLTSLVVTDNIHTNE